MQPISSVENILKQVYGKNCLWRENRMAIKKSGSRRVFELINGFIMIVMILICVIPLLHVLWASFSEPNQLAAHTGVLLHPLGFTLKGYQLVFKYPALISSYGNTIFYVVTATALNIILTSIGAYAFSRKNFMLAHPVTSVAPSTAYAATAISSPPCPRKVA